MLDNIQRFQYEGCSTRIKVNNVPKEVSRDTLYTFFSKVGEVTGVQQLGPATTTEHKQFMISFQQSEAARCALKNLDGVSLGGCKIRLGPPGGSGGSPPLHPFDSRPIGGSLRLGEKTENLSCVRFTSKHASNFHSYSRNATSSSSEEKYHDGSNVEPRGARSYKNCNLYILNLSLNMTNESLKVIIQASGEVRHVCVLATLDNAGRRRAFVDMATPEEACRVVENLHGKRIEGYELHISYAFIQRSGGPTMPFDGNPNSKSHEQRRSPHHEANSKSFAPRKCEDREKHRGAKKSLSTTTLTSSKVNRNTTMNLSSQINPNSESVPKSDSSSRTPESDRDSGFPFTPVSSCDPRGRSPKTLSSILFETSLPELNSYTPLNEGMTYSPWKFLVFDLSPVACIDSDDLFRFFVREGFSQLKSACLNVDCETGMSLGSGTLTFDCAEEYHKAFETINSKDVTFGGTKVKCAKLTACNSNKRLNYLMNGVKSNFVEALTPMHSLDSNVNYSVSNV